MHGRKPKSSNCGFEWMLEMMWGACLTGRYNCTLPRPPRHSQAVAGLRRRGRGARQPVQCWCPGRCRSSLVPLWTDARWKKQHTENILRAKESWKRHLEKSVWRVPRQIQGQRSATFAWSQQLGQMANRWDVEFGEQLSDEWLSGFHVSGSAAISYSHSLLWLKAKTGQDWDVPPRNNRKWRCLFMLVTVYWLGEYLTLSVNHAAALSLAVCCAFARMWFEKIDEMPVASESLKPGQCLYRFCCLCWAWCLRWCLLTLGTTTWHRIRSVANEQMP